MYIIQKQKLKNYLKLGILFFGVSIFIIACQKDDDLNKQEIKQTQSIKEQSRVQVKTGTNVSKKAINFIKQKTNNSFQLELNKEKISLSDGTAMLRNSALGTVDTTKEIVVNNQLNTKHTFKVISTEQTSNSITNLIIVETADAIYEYFLRYNFVDKIPYNFKTKSINLSLFNGAIETFNRDGTLTGTLTIQDGDVITVDGTTTPCPEPPITDSYPTGGGGEPNNPNNNDTQTDYNGNGSSGSSSGDNQGIYDVPCGLSYHHGECDGGVYGQHDSAPNSSLPEGMCSGSTIVVTDCNGNVLGQGRNNNTASKESDNDCNGTVGVLFPEDECDINNEMFNGLYSVNSPFNVDLSLVRASCDSIDTTSVAENAKFMCIYNKLVASPKFKDLFVDTFGEENSEMNVKFELVTLANPNAAGSCTIDISNPTEITITLNKSRINDNHPLTTASDIIHEVVHAFLKYKAHECNGDQIDVLNTQNLSETLNNYNYDCSLSTNQHNLMFDNLVPTMTNMLAEVLDDLVASEDINYFHNFWWDANNPNAVAENWNWLNYNDSSGNELEGCLYYMSLVGLGAADEFANEITNDERNGFLFNEYNILINNKHPNTQTLFDHSKCNN